MNGHLDGMLRPLLRGMRSLMKSSVTVRSLLADIDNVEEFGDLYEHEQMLADSVRVNAYRAAIARHVRPGDTVIDLGTGTGILALFAARARPRKIYAVDHSPMIEIARRIAARNQADNIEFLRINSRDFRPRERVDLILHEQIGDDLFDENMLENLLDLKRRALKPSGRIMPGKFELYLEPVSLRPEYRVPYIWERPVHDIEVEFLKGVALLDRFKGHAYTSRYLRPGAVDHLLCEPAPLVSFDLNLLEGPDEVPKAAEARRPVVRAGRLDGLCLFFRVIFDDTLAFDTSPEHPPTHWGNRLYRLEARGCREGEVLEWRLTMRDLTDPRTWMVTLH